MGKSSKLDITQRKRVCQDESDTIVPEDQSYSGEHKAIIDRELWEKVRAKMAENHRARRHRTNANQPSLLCGLVFDKEGNRFTPSHAVKNGKRYRYYVSQNAIHGRPAASNQPARIPARELEQSVFTEIRHFFRSEDRIASTLSSGGDDLATTRALVEGAQIFARSVDEESATVLSDRLAGILTRVTIHQDSIEINLSKEGSRARALKPDKVLAQQSKAIPGSSRAAACPYISGEAEALRWRDEADHLYAESRRAPAATCTISHQGHQPSS